MAEFIVSQPNGSCFDTAADENLLAAAQRAHWLVRYGCRNGNCEACAATLLKGRVRQAEKIIEASADTSFQPTILLCLCRAESDLSIALPGDPQHGSSAQARRYYARLNSCARLSSGSKVDATSGGERWLLHVTLPAGRLLPIYAGQYVLLEHNDMLIRAEIDTAASSGRELFLQSGPLSGNASDTAAQLDAAGYVTVICPLGYCYATAPQKSLLIVHDDRQTHQATLLKQALPQAQLIESTQLDRITEQRAPDKAFDTVLMCTQDQNLATTIYEQLLSRHVAFSEFRSDRNIWYRWRIWRQDDNGNRFMVAEALGEHAARQQAAELEARGHKQLYWAEPMVLRT